MDDLDSDLSSPDSEVLNWTETKATENVATCPAAKGGQKRSADEVKHPSARKKRKVDIKREGTGEGNRQVAIQKEKATKEEEGDLSTTTKRSSKRKKVESEPRPPAKVEGDQDNFRPISKRRPKKAVPDKKDEDSVPEENGECHNGEVRKGKEESERKEIEVEKTAEEKKDELDDTTVKKTKRKRKTQKEKEADAMPLAARTAGCTHFIGAHVSSAGGYITPSPTRYTSAPMPSRCSSSRSGNGRIRN